MKTIRIILLLLLLSGFDSPNNITPESLINEVVAKYKSHKSISYSIEYKIKFFSNEDTTYRSADCKLMRELKDSTTIENYWYHANTGREVFSFVEKTYTVESTLNSIWEYTGTNHKQEGRGNVADNVINVYFFKPENLQKTLEDTSRKITLESVMFNNIECWKLNIKFPDDVDYSESQKNLWIDKDSKIITKIDFSIKFQGNYQYNEWLLKNMEFDNFDLTEKEKRLDSLKQIYKVINAAEDEKNREKTEKVLDSGTKAYPFLAYHYQKQKTVNFSDYKGKVILLDFWYTSCGPCIKAIPEINNLYNKFKNNGFIALGVNSKDDYKKEKKLKKFFEYNKMDYPVLFVDHSVDSTYKVRAYPTFYLIDKKGKIVFSQVGIRMNKNNKSDTDSLEQIIKKYIKE